MTLRLPLLLASTSLLLAAGCSKPDAAPSLAASTTATATATAPSAPPAAPPAPKAEYSASDLWSEVQPMMRIDVLQHPPVTISGTAKTINNDPMGEYSIDLDAGGGNIVEIGFLDFGKAAKAKKLKVGAAVAANQCQVTMPQGNKLKLVSCVLK